MTKVTLYKYVREGGGVTVTPEVPPEGTPYTTMWRIIADEGMLVTRDGDGEYAVIDTDTADGWYEVPDPGEGR